ncbi:MAG TPA: hypothetical protein VFQ45_03980 [Longimicrobium sp.]|nr:hypothetical protein [Longimicrobium sp.]
MSTPFDGSWTDLSDTRITITSEADILTVVYSNGRGPFPGVSVTIGSPVIYVDFTDERPFTGVLTVESNREPVPGSKILWSNGTVWTRNPTSP